MTLDGYCDHTAVTPDAEVHQHYSDLINNADTILYGRITYELMQYWQPIAKNPSGEKAMDDFAIAIDKIRKVVFSHTLRHITWDSARLSDHSLMAEVSALKQQSGKDILVGSRSLIMQLLKQNLIDELQLCIHPVVAGGGLPLFENLADRKTFNLIKTETIGSNAVILYFEPCR